MVCSWGVVSWSYCWGCGVGCRPFSGGVPAGCGFLFRCVCRWTHRPAVNGGLGGTVRVRRHRPSMAVIMCVGVRGGACGCVCVELYCWGVVLSVRWSLVWVFLLCSVVDIRLCRGFGDCFVWVLYILLLFFQRAIHLRGLCSGHSFEFVGVLSAGGHPVVGVVSSFAHSVGGVGSTVGLSVVWVVLTVVFLLCVRVVSTGLWLLVVSTVSLVVGAPVLMPGWLFLWCRCHTVLVVWWCRLLDRAGCWVLPVVRPCWLFSGAGCLVVPVVIPCCFLGCRLLYRAASWGAGCYTVLLLGGPVVIPCWWAGCYTVRLLGVPVVIPCWWAGCYTVRLLGVPVVIPCWWAGCYTGRLLGVPVVIPCWWAGCYTVRLLGVPVVIPCWWAGCHAVLVVSYRAGWLWVLFDFAA